MQHTKQFYQFINTVYKSVKPYTQHLDAGHFIDDATAKRMIEDCENFTTKHPEFVEASNPDDRQALKQAITTVTLNLAYLINKWAEVEDRNIQ